MASPKAVIRQYGKVMPRKLVSTSVPLPQLESGDRLTRTEFERRYLAMPSHIRAELIEGVVYMSSPVRHQQHGKPHSRLNYLLVEYADNTPRTDCSDNATVRLDLDNEAQPDLVLIIDSAYGGQTSVSEDDYLEGAPELAVEIAASSASIDLHGKLNAYRRNGVREYIVWRTADKAFDWFHLVNEQYVPLTKDKHGIIRSHVFPGLWIHATALLAGDITKVRAALAQGLASPEHTAFVLDLKRRTKAKR